MVDVPDESARSLKLSVGGAAAFVAIVVAFIILGCLGYINNVQKRTKVDCYSAGLSIYSGVINGYNMDVESGNFVTLPSNCVYTRINGN